MTLATAGAAGAQSAPAPDGDLRSISEGSSLRVIKPGESGTLVAWWQERLNTWIGLSDTDLAPVAVDGIYGPITRAATEYFQTVNGSVAVDGVVHPADRVALEQSIDALGTGEVTPGDALHGPVRPEPGGARDRGDHPQRHPRRLPVRDGGRCRGEGWRTIAAGRPAIVAGPVGEPAARRP